MSDSARHTGDSGRARPIVLAAIAGREDLARLHEVLSERHDIIVLSPDPSIDEMRGHDAELLLLELPMPQMVELLHALRADDQLQSLPVLFIGDGPTAEDRLAAIEAGANGYVTRPLNERELVARVDAQIEICRLRTRAQRELAESQRRLETLVSNLPGMAYRCRNDRDLTMEFISSGVLQITGYSSEQFLSGQVRWADLWYPDDIWWTGEEVSRAIERERPFQFEYRIVHRDGSVRWVWEQGTPIYDGGESPIAFEGFVTDVTQRKSAEERVAKLADDLRLITDNLPALISYVDRDGRYTYNNQTYLEWFGRTGQQVQGRHLRDVLGEEAWEAIRGYVEKALEGERVRYELEIPYRVGSRYVYVDYVPDVRPDGTVAGFYALINDLTARRKAEAALRESEERFRAMADNAPVMSWVTDADGSCTFLSKPWYQFTGQTPETGLGDGWLNALHPEDQNKVWESYRHSLEDRDAFRLEFRLRRSDGAWRWAMCAAEPRLRDGEFFGHVGSVIDISDRKEAEDALRDSAQALRDADRLKDEFLATLSHELRTPMTSIIGWAQMIASGRTSQEELKLAGEAILRSAMAQKQLVEDVLDVSRITTGRMRLELQPVLLRRIVEEAVDTIRPAADAKRMTVEISSMSEPGLALVDPDRLQQVVWNILSNAVKFTPAKGHIHVRLRRSGDDALIEVSDDGPGIPADVLPHIFERFRQADSSSRRAHGGLGLGLSLAKELTELHGGRIEVETARGHGSTFTVCIPLSSDPGSSAHSGKSQSPGETTARLADVAVLLVDDDADALAMLGTALRKEGAAIETVSSVDEALMALAQRRPDVIVTDVAMPLKDGYDLLNEIRLADERLPVIALTAHEGHRRSREDRSDHFSDFLIKPVDMNDFVEAIARAAGREQ